MCFFKEGKQMKQLRISEKKQQILNQMQIHSVQDLLHYYPYRYEKHEEIPYINWVEKMKVCFEATLITKVTNRFLANRSSMQTAKVLYQGQEISIVLFNQPWFCNFMPQQSLTFFGVVQANKQVLIQKYNQVPLSFQLGIEPIYNKKEGISDKDLRKYIQKAITLEPVHTWIPQTYLDKYAYISKQEAIHQIHFPKNETMLKKSVQMLKYEEFLKFQLCIQQLNVFKDTIFKVPKVLKSIEDIILKLPFTLSSDQQKVLTEIQKDFEQPQSMYRILQGDVGSGKTIVAFLSMLQLHCQTALLAPTEILARQHYENFRKLNQNVVCIVGKMPPKEKQAIYEKIASGEVQHVIGTHAIFQENVIFKNLGFAVIDEQQRFGVNQRKTLLSKGKDLDVLIMSATPIPRTMAMLLYNDTAVSTIKTLPKNKKEIHSYLIRQNSVKPILKVIEDKIAEKQQVYVVCPTIEKNELGVRNVEEVYNSFLKVSQNKYQVGMLHGKMKQEEKNTVMQKFLANEIQLLVTTSVIEVGVDVKNANMMIIYDAHRFGLSQLHQLRGRCARGDQEGYCYFLTDEQEAIEKLEVLVKSQDGFLIAEQDLKLRGPGDILGVKQSGIPGFILGDIFNDQELMYHAKQDAKSILLQIEQYPIIQSAVLNQIDQYLD